MKKSKIDVLRVHDQEPLSVNMACKNHMPPLHACTTNSLETHSTLCLTVYENVYIKYTYTVQSIYIYRSIQYIYFNISYSPSPPLLKLCTSKYLHQGRSFTSGYYQAGSLMHSFNYSNSTLDSNHVLRNTYIYIQSLYCMYILYIYIRPSKYTYMTYAKAKHPLLSSYTASIPGLYTIRSTRTVRYGTVRYCTARIIGFLVIPEPFRSVPQGFLKVLLARKNPLVKYYCCDVRLRRSGLDVDKLDYFQRDARNSVGQHATDMDRFIELARQDDGRVYSSSSISISGTLLLFLFLVLRGRRFDGRGKESRDAHV